MSYRSAFVATLLAGATLLTTTVACAQDHLLTFGGGPNPQYNQVSLEKNIQYYQKVLADLGFKNTPHEIYFADGGSPLHTVKFEIPEGTKNSPDLTIADIFTNADDMSTRFRSTILRHIVGPSNSVAMSAWFDTTGKTLKPNDTLYFYFTGHGGEGTAGLPMNTTMDMWASQPERVRDFAGQLDKLDPAVDVTLFMVQCHSGGFANVIYKDANPKNGLSPQHRIGFFSTLYTNLAAGCTAVMNEEEYRDFSTFFFSALSGESRTGKMVEKPDFDKKGFTSLNDAFSYVLLHDDTIDIPVITSDQFVIDFSRLPTDKDGKDGKDLLDMKSPYHAIVDAATPAQRAVLDGLSEQLKLTGDDRVAQAQKLADKIDNDRRQLQREARGNSDRTIRNARQSLLQSLTFRFPELSNPWREDAQLLLRTQFPTIRDYATSLPAFKELEKAVAAANDAGHKDYDLELQWVLTQRFINRAKISVLSANLPKVAKPEVTAQYTDMVKRENAPFAPATLASAK